MKAAKRIMFHSNISTGHTHTRIHTQLTLMTEASLIPDVGMENRHLPAQTAA